MSQLVVKIFGLNFGPSVLRFLHIQGIRKESDLGGVDRDDFLAAAQASDVKTIQVRKLQE
jgi:hypothetical protein